MAQSAVNWRNTHTIHLFCWLCAGVWAGQVLRRLLTLHGTGPGEAPSRGLPACQGGGVACHQGRQACPGLRAPSGACSPHHPRQHGPPAVQPQCLHCQGDSLERRHTSPRWADVSTHQQIISDPAVIQPVNLFQIHFFGCCMWSGVFFNGRTIHSKHLKEILNASGYLRVAVFQSRGLMTV